MPLMLFGSERGELVFEGIGDGKVTGRVVVHEPSAGAGVDVEIVSSWVPSHFCY